MLPSALRRWLRRFSATAGLIILALVVATLPTRPVWQSVWPERVEEIVFADGLWALQSASRGAAVNQTADIRARTRPTSLVAARLVDSSVHYGFVLERAETDSGQTVLLSIAPEKEVVVDSAEVVEWVYPNALDLVERFRLAYVRLVSRTPSLH